MFWKGQWFPFGNLKSTFVMRCEQECFLRVSWGHLSVFASVLHHTFLLLPFLLCTCLFTNKNKWSSNAKRKTTLVTICSPQYTSDTAIIYLNINKGSNYLLLDNASVTQYLSLSEQQNQSPMNRRAHCIAVHTHTHCLDASGGPVPNMGLGVVCPDNCFDTMCHGLYKVL